MRRFHLVSPLVGPAHAVGVRSSNRSARSQRNSEIRPVAACQHPAVTCYFEWHHGVVAGIGMLPGLAGAQIVQIRHDAGLDMQHEPHQVGAVY